jgi:hypothetical protein
MNPNKKPSQPKDATSRPQATLKFPLFSKYVVRNHHDWYDEDAKEEVEQALSKAEGNRKALEGNLEACLDINKQLVAENKTYAQKTNLLISCLK